MYSYIEENYSNMLNDETPPSRLYFNLKYNKSEGKCVMTGKPTKWNPVTEKYERFADEKAKEAYREMFKKRMLTKYGKTHILDEPEQQKKMLSNRNISIDYTWSNGDITRVNSKLEKDFLSFVESTYNFNSQCFTEPPTIYYSLNKEVTSFYLPDFYVPSLNLIIEIKGSNPHYQERDSYKEKLKENATIKEGFNFIQINDNHYIEFNKFFLDNVINN
ncbi:MAG: hypothetical protein [Bacteriophage sp.]|nr:MAG: hypothetical protein [Bacteriophage sp.]